MGIIGNYLYICSGSRGVCENPLDVIKSSLVFVLVWGGCLAAPLMFFD